MGVVASILGTKHPQNYHFCGSFVPTMEDHHLIGYWVTGMYLSNIRWWEVGMKSFSFTRSMFPQFQPVKSSGLD